MRFWILSFNLELKKISFESFNSPWIFKSVGPYTKIEAWLIDGPRNTEKIFLTLANNDPCLGQHALIASLICGKMWKGTLRCVVFWQAFDLLKAAGSKRKPERLYIPGNFHQKRKNVNVLSLMWHDLLDQIKIQMQGETCGYVRARIWAEYWTFMLQKIQNTLS